ncbi:MAG: hypothetical protein IPP71_22150 [Bacteroidetes bacterium]|nr:hypothetical protein [Bacteroidota bacterium]
MKLPGNSWFYLWLASFSVNTSCTTKNKNNSDSDVIGISDSINYLKIADATQFLPDWSKENILVYHTIAEPDLLHPTNGTSSMRTDIFQFTQMFLIRLDFQTLQIAPGLLKAMPILSPDGLSYDCELRDEPRWDDGSKLTSNDVVFTVKASKCQLTDNPHAKSYWDNLKEIIVDASNPKKFKVVMKTPYMHNLIFWADWPIMQATFYDKNKSLEKFSFSQFNDSAFKADQSPELVEWANEFNSSKFSRELNFLTGIGMYKVEGWDPGQSVTLERKKNHWSIASSSIYETSFPDKIIYRINKDPNAQALDFKAQVLDGSNLLATKTLLELQTDSNFNRNYNSRFTDSFNYTYIGMNMRPDGVLHKKFFTDKKVRRAMALLTPVDDLNKVINKGKNKRMVGTGFDVKERFR